MADEDEGGGKERDGVSERGEGIIDWERKGNTKLAISPKPEL